LWVFSGILEKIRKFRKKNKKILILEIF